MTDKLDSEFLLFSEMLDNESSLGESTVALLGDDGALLLDLREQLRGDDHQLATALPDNFARTTSTLVLQRFQALPSWNRRLITWDPVLRANPFSSAGLPWLFGLSLLGLGAFSLSWTALGALATLVLIPGLALRYLYGKYLPKEPALLEVDGARLEFDALSRSFYLIPTLAVILTSALAGQALSALGRLSLSFQAGGSNLKLIGLASTLVVFAWLMNACMPLWKAYELATRGRTARTFFVQGMHGLWMIVAMIALMFSSGRSRSLFIRTQWPEILILASVALIVVMPTLLSRRRGKVKTPMGPAFRRFVAGFLIGVVPIAAVFGIFYQANLTRQVELSSEYQKMTSDVETWLAAQRAVAPSQNGMESLRAIFFTRTKGGSGSETPQPPEAERQAAAIAERLSRGRLLYAENQTANQTNDPKFPAELKKARADFLAELPRIEAAVAKPHFTYLSRGEFSMEGRIPNYVLGRSISQALAGLVEERLAAGDRDQALKYVHLNLRWSTKLREGSLIGLMISVAQQRIAESSARSLIRGGSLSDAQLRSLSDTLLEIAPERTAFRDFMLRDIYIVDKAFARMASGDSQQLKSMSFEGSGKEWGLGLVPKSYWESERKVYLNLQLSQVPDWTGLAAPLEDGASNLQKMLPFSIAAQGVVANTRRAQIQFMWTLSRISALRLEIALERYRKQFGHYPERLEHLAPRFIEAVPIDAMSPNLWKKKTGFSYSVSGKNSYRLRSDSPVYSLVKASTSQVYEPRTKPIVP